MAGLGEAIQCGDELSWFFNALTSEQLEVSWMAGSSPAMERWRICDKAGHGELGYVDDFGQSFALGGLVGLRSERVRRAAWGLG